MTVTLAKLDDWLTVPENERLEFKAATNSFHFDKLVRYCAALANEGGGSIVLGVTDAIPRKIVGSAAFLDLERTKAGLLEKLRLRIDAAELHHPAGRVVVFTAPGRPMGVPVAVDGAYWMRAGEDMVPMTPDLLRRIFAETTPDFSAEICPRATIDDLDARAIEEFRRRWFAKACSERIKQSTSLQLLRDADLIWDEGISCAALILLGTRTALTRYLGQAEVIFEYRSTEVTGPASQRQEFRQGLLLFYDQLWELINLRNDKQHYQDGLFILDIPTFSERAIREAVLNAVAHRDYQHAGSVFVRQFSRRIEIISPGALPDGVTPENIVHRQHPRNRRLADSLSRCGLVERAGEGADLMFEECVRHSKHLPDFSHTDAYQVALTLHGEVQDPAFVRFLDRVEREQEVPFSTRDFLTLDFIRRRQPVPQDLRDVLRRMIDMGVVETVGTGRGTRYQLSDRFYTFSARPRIDKLRYALARDANRTVLLQHIINSAERGAKLDELHQLLPALTCDQVRTLLRELQRAGQVAVCGSTKGARWVPVQNLIPDDLNLIPGTGLVEKIR